MQDFWEVKWYKKGRRNFPLSPEPLPARPYTINDA